MGVPDITNAVVGEKGSIGDGLPKAFQFFERLTWCSAGEGVSTGPDDRVARLGDGRRPDLRRGGCLGDGADGKRKLGGRDVGA